MPHLRIRNGIFALNISTPAPGQLAIVRRRPFVISEVFPSALSTKSTRVRMTSVDDDGQPEDLEVVWELEPGASLRETSQLPTPDRYDEPETLAAFLDAVRWGTVSQADDKALQSPFRAGIELDDYQLDPVVRALTMPRVNLLIADDVGLGKTIEAGLVIHEMLLRHRARSVLIVCPSSLQAQWRDEMRDKFGLEFRIIDRDAMAELRRTRGLHVNPWQHFPRLITSMDFLKRERPLRLFRETLPSAGEPTYPRRHDLLIVDEAHNIAPSGRGRYAISSQRTEAIREIAAQFEHKLFLSATPHNGYRESFSALLELLDNQRFARGVMPDRLQLEAVMIRRLKSELKLRWDGSRRFADRNVLHLELPFTGAERDAHAALKAYADQRLARATSEGERTAAEFVMKLLKKRLFSSPAAFFGTLEKHRKTLSGSPTPMASAARIEREFSEFDEELADDESQLSLAEERTEEVTAQAGRYLGAATADEAALLDNLSRWASLAVDQPDTKALKLLDWLKTNLRPGGTWTDRRVIIFTEYRATQNWLFNLLAQHGFAAGDRLKLIYGGLPLEDREKIKAAFQADPKQAPVRILLATDAASEGLNLQNHCADLIHYEIPWNPNRMEQRNGRVDRHGQKQAEVRIHHFVGSRFRQADSAAKPGDLDGDLEFLARAALKVETIREDLGKVGPVIAAQVEEAMLGRRSALNTVQAEKDNEAVRKLLKFDRQLRSQLEKLSRQLVETRDALDLTPANIERSVRTALILAGQPPLIAESEGVWRLPALTGAWTAAKAGLAHPHTGIERPIVFDAGLAQGRDDRVLAHLNHPLVALSLRLLRAEVWNEGPSAKLARVSACLVDDNALSDPVLLVHGRIVVLGADQHRVHEEVITAGGRLVEGRFQRLNVGETRKAVEALGTERVQVDIERILTGLWPRVGDSALKSLEARMAERSKNLEETLRERGENEAVKLATVLQELAKSIRAELAEDSSAQMTFEFTSAEKDQHRRDLQSLHARLDQIPAEIERETSRLKARYQQVTPRLFPFAVTFAIPRRAALHLMRNAS